jgi:hypothetical protein
LNDEVRGALAQVREALAGALGLARDTMVHPGTGHPGGATARGGYRTAPGGPGEGSGNETAEADDASDAWATLPDRFLDELEKGTEGRFSKEFAALLRAYYKTLAEANGAGKAVGGGGGTR